LAKQILELLEERIAYDFFASHLEEEAQTGMAWICVHFMLGNDLIVRFEQRPEGKSVGVRIELRADNDLIQETDIYTQEKQRLDKEPESQNGDMPLIEVAYLRLKATGFQRKKLYAEGDSEASKSPRPKARFSQIGHGGGKRNHALRDANVTVEQRSAVSNARETKSKKSRKIVCPTMQSVETKDTAHPSFVPRTRIVLFVSRRWECVRHVINCLCNALPRGRSMALNCITAERKAAEDQMQYHTENAINKGQTY
jgi:hypothetical protein